MLRDLSIVLGLVVSFLLLVVTFMTFCAICVQATVYVFQLKEMRKSTDAATKAAKAAEDSVTLARENAHLDQRAWVAAVDIKGVPELGKLFNIVVTSKNTGKTFAKNLRQPVVVEVIEGNNAPNFALEEWDNVRQHVEADSVALLAPNGDFDTTSEVRKDTPPNETTQADLDKIARREITVFVHGKLTYDDIFGCSHWTTFCFRLRPDLRYVSHGVHNDADDNHCP